MDSKLEYFLLRIEQIFYEQNPQLLDETQSCNAQKGLPCHCLSSMSVNFWGYVVKNCYKMEIENRFDIQQDVKCILSIYCGRDFAPIFANDDKAETRYYYKICKEEASSQDKIYIARRQKGELVDINEKKPSDVVACITEARSMCAFLERFIVSMRTQSKERESLALLIFMMFFFPNRTMKLVYEYVKGERSTTEGKKRIKEYMTAYKKFIDGLGPYVNYGFSVEFSVLFKEWTGIYVGEWIEDTFGNERLGFHSEAVLKAAYNRNSEEMRRRSSVYYKIQKICR